MSARHGWQGHLLNVISGGSDLESFRHPDWNGPAAPGDYMHALVMGVLPYQVTARIGQQQVMLTAEDWAWTGFKTADEFLQSGRHHLRSPHAADGRQALCYAAR